MLTFDVQIWGIRKRPDRAAAYQLRWRVGVQRKRTQPAHRYYKYLPTLGCKTAPARHPAANVVASWCSTIASDVLLLPVVMGARRLLWSAAQHSHGSGGTRVLLVQQAGA
ncbi:hypothetical protein OG735_41045 (plasmid) [Streptomyces sp. NBC_01210]|uniref:hypothetical protein n=1 Tax=Streptomyces sp. NBC_01210 TaxID=2903774 RepID=UPI002E0FFFC9|nr:hypothetical protein OG735_41045 [Streptomyces sp. NBC_01210]